LTFRVRWTSLPVTVVPFRRSRVVSKRVDRFAFEAVRKSFSERSTPARERPCVE
jgi:hypothetical protein